MFAMQRLLAGTHRDMNPGSYEDVLTRQHLDILRSATDFDNQPQQITAIDGVRQIRLRNNPDTFAAGYINYYATSHSIFLPKFADVKADSTAKEIYAQLYPGRAVIQINIDSIAADGGGIHCTTPQEII